MSTENTGSVSVTVVTQQETPSFLNDSLQLKKLFKDVSKATKEAVDVLIACLGSNDEKVRMNAATKLLEFQVSIAKEINQDQFQRMIAEIKLRNPTTKVVTLTADEEERQKKQRPIVDFSTIRSVE